MKVYKIRDENGLYSTGGMEPDFTKGGKTWSNIGHVKNHLRQFIDSRRLEVYANAEIVVVEYTEKDVQSLDILEFLGDIAQQDLDDNKYDYRREKLENTRNRIAYMKEHRNEAR